MRRSKYGYLLLALLVITGLAGTITSTSISGKERKFAVSSLKDTKNDVLKCVKDLTEAQLDFKAAPDKWSIKECTYHIAISEKNLWDLLQATLKQPANPEKRSEIKWTDEQLISVMENRTSKVKTLPAIEPVNTPYKTLDEALESFKTTRANHIKYIKNTTEDLRNHVVQMSFGWLDCYQLCLMISAYSNKKMQQIKEVKLDPNFPSR
ncbi:MAG: DinB family protein [Chitinophagales bacterium]